MAYTDKFDRSDTNTRTARQIPEAVVPGIIQDAQETSAVLSVANVHTMRAFQERYRLTNSFPGAFWITGEDDVLGGSGDGSQTAKDSAFKQTTSFQWTNKYLTPEELAVMATMPDNWRQDSDVTWEEIRAAIRTAAAKQIDRAILFGDSAYGPLPSSFGDGVVAEALAAGNFTVVGTNFDRADDYAAVGEALAETGYDLNGFLTRNAEMWKIRRLRDGDDRPLVGDITSGGKPNLYGVPLTEVSNGAWDQGEATAIAGDWTHLHVGIRKDMTFDMSNEAPLFNPATGALIYAPFQQDGEVMRFFMRLGYVITDPLKNLTGAREFPFHVLLPAGYSA